MSLYDDYLKAYEKRGGMVATSDLHADYLRAKQKIQKQKQAELEQEYAPVRTTTSDDDGLDFFQKGAFEDGRQKDDLWKTILGTTGDIGVDLVKGAWKLVGGIADAGYYGAAGIADALGNEDYAEKLRSAPSSAEAIDGVLYGVDSYLDQYSLLGKTGDAVAEGLGQAGTIILTGGLLGAAGLGAAGITAVTTGVVGASSFGSGMSEAYEGGATDEEAATYGLIKAVVDAGSELIFGGLGKTVKALGFSKGLSSLDDIFAKKLSGKIANQVAKNFVQFGVKASAEGVEEVLAGLGSAIGKKLTYMTDKELTALIKDENLLEQFVVGAVTSGLTQSGVIPGMKGGSLVEANKHGRDFISGLNANEETVVKKVYEDRVAEKAKGGKVTTRQKNNIYDAVLRDLERGRISVDTIEEIFDGENYSTFQNERDAFFGSDTFKAYKDTVASEEAQINRIKEQMKELESAPNTVGNAKRYEDLQRQIEEIENSTKRAELKAQLDSEAAKLNEMRNQIHTRVSESLKDSKLYESYRELARSGEKFKADVSKYQNENARKTIQNIMDSGVANNTNEFHEVADWLAKISADKGIIFSTTDTKRLKGTRYEVKGKTVNGFVDENGNITVNLDSKNGTQFTVGHEITHVLENTAFYSELQSAIKNYAISKMGLNAFNARLKQIEEIYKGGIGDPDKELTADLIGEYIFSDTDFIYNLSANHRNLFQKIFDEIKYLCKVATAGSKEARELERVKKIFEDAYRATKNTAAESGAIKFSIDQKYASEMLSWDGKTKKVFTLGTTSKALQSIGVRDSEIRLNSGKATDILNNPDHDMDQGTLAKLPEVLENPIAILKSEQVTDANRANNDGNTSRLVIFGTVNDTKGVPISVILELMPVQGGKVLELSVVASAYGKTSHLSGFVQKSDILYLDPDKKRTNSWLQSVGVQFPSDAINYGPVGTVTYSDGKVNIQGIPFSQISGATYIAAPKDIAPMADWQKKLEDYKNKLTFSLSESENGEYADTFYSQMGKVIDSVKQEKLGAASVVNMLRGKGVKAEEIKWSGIEQWLEGKKSVTKQELQEFIRNNQLEIEEQERTEAIQYSDEQRAELDRLDAENDKLFDQMSDNWYALFNDGIPIEILGSHNMYDRASRKLDARGKGATPEAKAIRDAIRAYDKNELLMEAIRDEAKEQHNSARWKDYTLEGGENYREYLFKMPGSNYSNPAMKVHWGSDNSGVLAHARVQDFTHNDEPVLFIEEIQSDWHNAGRQYGYVDRDLVRQYENERDTYVSQKVVAQFGQDLWDTYKDKNKAKYMPASDYVQIYNAEGDHIFEWGENNPDKRDLIFKGLDGAPNAPYSKNYHEFVLKNMLRKAAEGGYSYLAWTPAEMQEERWSSDYAEGYRIEYDQDIPKFLNKYGKQWGAHTEDISLDGLRNVTVHAIPVTPAMKQSVLYEGQPKFSLSDAQPEYTTESEVQFSLSNDTAYMDKAIAANNASMTVDNRIMEETKVLRERIAGRMKEIKDRGLVALPEDVEGNTYIANSSYDGTEENTTICPRSLASEAFVDAVSEYLGRPLTVEEQIYISQDLQGRTLTPECLYCYVATDRKAYRAFLGEYVKQRDAVIEKLKANPNADLSRSGALYTEFRNGRKDTNPMYARFKMWTDAYLNGKPMIEASHLANINKLMGDINSEFGAELKPQIVDAMKYAQSASWAKKRVNYVAYNGHILNWKQSRINKLNSHYGLRMYSFSDFHPAFVLENMQMITDASVRGLKMLGYTKDTDFVEIFAPSGMNINVSTFGFESGGQVFENNITGASWETAKELRDQYPNVGVTFVATNDTIVEWALAQDWIDVVIPYHLVRTGAEVAKALNYTNYTSESSDTKTADWKKGDAKYIAPTAHNNDKATYLAALEKNHLKPRFERFLDNPNYMKLVNECRQSASESKPVQPVFNEDAAMKALAKLEANGYYQPIGGSVDRMYEIAGEVAEAMTQEIGPTMSLSMGEVDPYEQMFNPMGYFKYQEGVAPVRGGTVSKNATVGSRAAGAAPDLGPVKGTGQKPARVLTKDPNVSKKKSNGWSLFKDNFIDRGTVFETMSMKSGNRELQAKWKSIGRAESSAQWFMEHGNTNAKSLKSIRDAVEKSGKTQAFYDYLHHLHNVDRMAQNKPVFGIEVTAEKSRAEAAKLEKANPEFKQWADDVYSYMIELREMMVENGVISEDARNLWSKMYPHYVPIRRNGDYTLDNKLIKDTKRTGINAPIKKATGGSSDILPLFDTMALRTEQTFKAIAKNSFGVELKNMLGSTIENEDVGIDDAIDSVDADVVQPGVNGRQPTFTVFENGKKVTFEITEEMYDTMQPKSKAMAYSNKVLNKANNIRRGLLTEYNPAFMLTNPIKDTQDVLMNSQHPARTYANYPKAIAELWNKNGQYYQEYMEHGGEQNTYFDGESKTFAEEKSGLSKVIGFPLEKISQINNFIERIPRMAEYIASRKMGRSIDVSMLDAARVTTDFSAGGDAVKLANRNGFTFLNASVQGAVQQVRNIREAKHEGLKGWVKLAAKIAAAGLPEMLLNHLLWDDDEDYAELSDYVKQNYYIVGKYGDGKFIRIPKGRTAAVIQSAFTQMQNLITGDDEADFEAFAELAISNLAPSNPLDNNLFAPIKQAVSNTTWYGDDLVPTRLQDLPAAEQYDETTDEISKWLGEKLNISPYKINYLLDQYSGAIGDVVLPMMTTEAERGNENWWGNLIAPITDKFTTDSVMKNQNVSDFYTKKDELAVNANASGATDEDVLMSKYMNSVNAELAKLYAEKRKIQNSNLPDAEKYAAVRDVQKQIVDLTKEALGSYDDITFEDDYREGGEYARMNGKLYKLNKDGEWEKLSADEVTKYEVTRAAGNAPYATDGTNHYRWYVPGEDADKDAKPGWRKVTEKELERQSEVTSGLGISPEDYWSNREEYCFAYDNPESYAVAKAVGGYEAYKGYSGELYDIKADKDQYGKSISGSRKAKVLEYINNLDADYYTKIILWKSEYNSDDTYNVEIIEYLNGREDLSFAETVAILRKLGFKVTDDGAITW